MDCPGGLHTEKGGGERGAFFDQREEDILVGQCWKKQEMGASAPIEVLPQGLRRVGMIEGAWPRVSAQYC